MSSPDRPGGERLDAAGVQVGVQQIAHRLGYGQDVPPHLYDAIDEALAHMRELIEPRGAWREIPIRIATPAGIDLIEGDRLHVGAIIAAQLRAARSLAVFVVTIGSHLEQEARAQLAGGRALEGYLLDAAGSAAAEACADLMARRLAAAAEARDWKTTNRYSPGYCSWPTTGQGDLFALLPPQPAGVRLTDSALMLPLKSVSGVIGLGPGVEHLPYPCDACGVRNCPHRLAESNPNREGDAPAR